MTIHKTLRASLVLLTIALTLTACGGGGGGGGGTTDSSASLQTATVTGSLQEESSLAQTFLKFITPASVQADVPTMIYLDDSSVPMMVGPGGEFTISDLADGNHSLYWDAD